MVDKRTIGELVKNKLVVYYQITKEEYETYKNDPEVDFVVFKRTLPQPSKENDIYEYIKIMKADLEGEKLNTALLLLADLRQQKLEGQVGCIYAYVIFAVVLSVCSFIIFLVAGLSR